MCFPQLVFMYLEKKKQRGEKERQVVPGGHGLDIQKKARLNFRMIFGQYWSGL